MHLEKKNLTSKRKSCDSASFGEIEKTKMQEQQNINIISWLKINEDIPFWKI